MGLAGWPARTYEVMKNPHVEVVSIGDLHLERAQQFAEKNGLDCTVRDNFDEMLADERVDIVDVTGPSFVHAEQGAAAAKAGKHVLVEKPIALTMEENRALRDAIAELTGTEILSTERLGIASRVEELMDQELEPKGVEVVRFFVREIQPPPAVRQAIELKLQREQEVQAQVFQTEIVREQAEQKRVEAEGIRDAQHIIGESLTSAYLSYYYMQTLQQVGQKEGNVIIAPTEGGNLLFDVPTTARRQ